ncbi:MAG: arginase family protein, partial [Candidatus Thermoplasmatota archaeon]|nr:arginase family protein [Candidatus Thermoplasmatota archaeon]
MEGGDLPTFLGLGQGEGNVDVAILSLPYELTTSYGQGTALGPMACIEASTQVELYDAQLGQDLPAGLSMHTIRPWNGEEPTLLEQLNSMVGYLTPWFRGDCFPLCLGGEHGILPPIMEAARHHPLVDNNLSNLTVVQIDAHGDLREHLDGEKYSHACAAARALDAGIGSLLQVGIRAYSKEEHERMMGDERITTFFAGDTQSPCQGADHWNQWLEMLSSIEGPVHLTIDIDGLDGSLVPATGTPVPGGLTYWQVHETIHALFNAPNAVVVSADVNEIGVQEDSPLTQFTAAMLATNVVAAHASARQRGAWNATAPTSGSERLPHDFTGFSA